MTNAEKFREVFGYDVDAVDILLTKFIGTQSEQYETVHVSHKWKDTEYQRPKEQQERIEETVVLIRQWIADYERRHQKGADE